MKEKLYTTKSVIINVHCYVSQIILIQYFKYGYERRYMKE